MWVRTRRFRKLGTRGRAGVADQSREPRVIVMQKRTHWGDVCGSNPSTSLSWHPSSPEPSLRALDQLKRLVDIGFHRRRRARIRPGRRTVATRMDGPVSSRHLGTGAVVCPLAAWGIKRPRHLACGRRYRVGVAALLRHLARSGGASFLTDLERRRAFRNTLVEGTDPGSHVIIATLAPGGSEKCSGLPIREYDARITMRELGSNSDLVSESRGRQRIAIYRPISAK